MPAVGTFTVTVGDTLFPLNTVLRHGNRNPIDLALYTVKFLMELVDGTVELATTATGVTAHPTQVFTAEADDDYLTCNNHGVEDGDEIVVASSGTLPAGLAASTRYYPANIHPNKFQLSTLPNGPVINITTDGTGTHTFYIVGSAQMDFAAGNVDPAQVQRGWFELSSGAETKKIPEGNRWYEIKVVNIGT